MHALGSAGAARDAGLIALLASSAWAAPACEVRFPVRRRFVAPSVSPGEPYLVLHPGPIEVVFRVAEGSPASWTRSERAADRVVVDDRDLGARIRVQLLETDGFSVPCDRMPPDGVWFVDLCPRDVPAARCGVLDPSTGVGLLTVSRDGGVPHASMMASANDGYVLVSFAPARETANP